MKSLGVSRPVDKLGRIVIPKEIRRQLGIRDNDRLEIYINEDQIILSKTDKKCESCGTSDNIARCGNITLCFDCAERISKNILDMRE